MTNTSFTEAQRAKLRQMMASFSSGPAGPQGQTGQPGPQGPPGVTTGGNSSSQWKPDEIGFFDSQLALTVGQGPMVCEGKDVFYRSVHLFVKRVKDAILTKGKDLVRTNLSTCLRGVALIWYMGKLSELERLALRQIDGQWVLMLLKHFCPSHSFALSALINKRFTLADIRARHEPSIYIQSMVINAKDAKFDTAFQQLTWAWRNLDPVLKRDIKQPNEDTTLTAFLEEVELKKEVWQEVYQPRG